MNLLTRRFPTILGLLLLTLGAVFGWWYFTKNKPQVAEEIKPQKVRITNTADNKFTVSWTTKQATEGYIEYGSVGEKLTQTGYDDRDTTENVQPYTTHHITVSELQPSTQYAFRIMSGKQKARFDNNGSPYSVTTGPTIAEPPASKSLYGEVAGAGKPATGAIVYLALPGAAPASTLVTSSANYSFTLSTVRTSDLQKYIEYDAQATVANLTVESGSQESIVTVTTANAEPVPKITLGQNADFRTAQQAPIAQVEPQASAAASPAAETPTIFNVEPLAGSEQRTSQLDVTLLNPEEEGETIATTRPEFSGTGPEDTVLSITVNSVTPYADTVTVGSNGSWKWTPPANLEPGEHTVTIAYVDEAGISQKITRKFFVSAALAAEGDPSFVATPSASVKASSSPKASASLSPSPSPSKPATTSASPREVIPSTESGVPVTGIVTPTLLTLTVGFVIMVLGALMLAL